MGVAPPSKWLNVHISQTTEAISTKLAERKSFYHFFIHCESEENPIITSLTPRITVMLKSAKSAITIDIR